MNKLKYYYFKCMLVYNIVAMLCVSELATLALPLLAYLLTASQIEGESTYKIERMHLLSDIVHNLARDIT